MILRDKKITLLTNKHLNINSKKKNYKKIHLAFSIIVLQNMDDKKIRRNTLEAM